MGQRGKRSGRRGVRGSLLVQELEPRVLMAGNLPPTALVNAVLATTGVQNRPYTISYNTLLTATHATDPEGASIWFLVRSLPFGGVLQLTRPGVGTFQVVPASSQAWVIPGDTLTWTPAVTTTGQVVAMNIRAWDHTQYAANSSNIRVNMAPQVAITTLIGQSWEALGATWGHNGLYNITRTGGNLAQPLTVNVKISGTGTPVFTNSTQSANYQLLTVAGQVIGTGSGSNGTGTVTIPANASNVLVIVNAIEDNKVDATLTSVLTLASDANTTNPAYTVSPTASSGTVSIIDSHPTVAIAANSSGTIRDGAANQQAFTVTRTAAPGGVLPSTIVTLTYNKTFNAALGEVAPPASLLFAPNEMSKTITMTALNTGTVSSLTLTATLAGNTQSDQSLNASVSGTTGTSSTATASVLISNQDVAPLISPVIIQRSTKVGGTFTLSFADLVKLTGARLGSNATGFLKLSLGTITTGTVTRTTSGATTATAAAAGQLFFPGDRLTWTAPTTTAHNSTVTAFTLFAADGALLSTNAATFKVLVV